MINVREITPDLSLAILDLNAFSVEANLVIKREQERAGTLFVLKTLLGNDTFKLSYSEHNKPYIDKLGAHISISHSHDKLAVVLNQKENTGVDIELMRDKVLKIKHKFVNETEALVAQDDVEMLITIWAAKEALYKCYGLKQLDFKTNLFIAGFENDKFTGIIETKDFRKKMLLKKEKIDDYMLVYVLNEITE